MKLQELLEQLEEKHYLENDVDDKIGEEPQEDESKDISLCDKALMMLTQMKKHNKDTFYNEEEQTKWMDERIESVIEILTQLKHREESEGEGDAFNGM